MLRENLSDYAKNEGITVYMDVRENPELEIFLKNHGTKVILKQLKVGDFIISERGVVERKTRSDFENSIIDGRLFEQAIRLRENYERVIYIIEGTKFPERVRREAVLSAISSLILNYGASIFFTPNMKKTAEILFILAKKEQTESKKKIILKNIKRSKDEYLQTVQFIAGIPGVGEKTAITLLNKYGSIKRIMELNERDLESIPRIGKEKAKKIYQFINKKWNTNQPKRSTDKTSTPVTPSTLLSSSSK